MTRCPRSRSPPANSTSCRWAPPSSSERIRRKIESDRTGEHAGSVPSALLTATARTLNSAQIVASHRRAVHTFQMFNVPYLNELRNVEMERLVAFIPESAKVLE